MRRLTCAAAAVAVLLTPLSGHAADSPRLMRFPDIHDRQVVFSYAGDLWVASVDGGSARQLTSGVGMELFPKFSPDGRSIAFTGQYGGDEQVFVVPAEGGRPRQLTFYPARGPLNTRSGFDNQVTGWKPDGSAIVFRSLRDQTSPVESRLYTVPVAGGDATALPMARAGAGVYSPDGARMLFSPLARDFRTWKRYEGGLAQDLYIVDLATRTMVNVTNDRRTDRDPMWTNRGIYFLSDRDGRLNLYGMDPASTEVRKLTNYTDGDAKFASADAKGDVVFEFEGGLRFYDAAAGAARDLQITAPANDAGLLPRTVKVADHIEASALSPGGQRLLFVARGDILVTPVKGDGPTLNLTHSSTAHDREASWSPDGRTIAFISDATGEEELWLVGADGGGSARQLTRDSKTRYYHPVWSPDGRALATIDKEGNLFTVDTATGAKRKVGATKAWTARQYAWSPDSRHLAYAQVQSNNFNSIQILDTVSGRTETVTDPLYDSFEPTWSPDGQYLWFLSIRDAQLQITETEWNYAPSRQTRIYGLALRAGSPNPFGVPDANDETKEDLPLAEPLSGRAGARSLTGVVEGPMRSSPAPADGRPRGAQPAGARSGPIEFEGLPGRVFRVPLEADNYVDLAVGRERLVYRIAEPGRFGEGDRGTLHAFSFKTLEAKKLKDDVTFYDPDRGALTFLVRDKAKAYSVVRAEGDPLKIDVSGLAVRVDPRQEWTTIFNEVWRRYRDYFYDPAMHGHDWAAIGDHYRRLLPGVGDRAGLNYLIGEMIGELNVGHAYTSGGDEGLPARPKTGLLGARLEREAGSRRWRIAKIFEGDNADPLYRSPLTEVGSRAKVGEYLLSIDGQPLTDVPDPYLLLAGKAGQVVELTVGTAADSARRLRVKTLESEAPLLLLERTLSARRTIDRLSDGRIGYVHITDMGPTGLKEFVKDWYGQIRKDGIIIDVRGNAGGNVSRMILERLVRPAYTRGYVTGVQVPQTYPWGSYTQVFTGQIAMLANETTMSDGDTIAWTFKTTGRGALIGKRTWGGVIGTGDTGPLLDGGLTQVPQFALAGPKGEWIIEGEGVSPDIEVDYDQPALRDGSDAQISAAVANLMGQIADRPGALKGPQPYPVKP